MAVRQDKTNLAKKDTHLDALSKKKADILTKVVKKNEDIAWRVLEGEVIIITPEDSVQHYMNEVGSTIWGFADGKRTVQEIIELMKAEYKENIEKKLVTPEEIETDVISFISELSSEEKKIVTLE